MHFLGPLIVSAWFLLSQILNPIQPLSNNVEQLPQLISQETTVTVSAVGDINMGRKTGQEILKGNIDFPFEFIKTELQAFDITFGNLESQLRDTGGITQNPNNVYIFSGPKEGAKSLKRAGFDIVSTANNHMWDYGYSGLTQTLESLGKEDVEYVGSSKETGAIPDLKTIEVNGQKIGFMAATDLLNGFERTEAPKYVTMTSHPNLMKEITEASKQVDWLLVSLHMGVEYQTTPSPKKQTLAKNMIDNGADIILGHHPHVRQPVMEYNEGLIAYSLGNFAFWQPFSNETKTGTLLKLELNPDGTFDYEAVNIEAGWQPKLMAQSPEP